jgi:hypothetical protein
MRVTTKTESKCKLNHRQDLSEGGSPGTSVRGPESQEGAREFLKDPIAVAIYVYFDVFIFFFIYLYFQLKSSILRKVSVCSLCPKAVLFRLAKFLLEALTTDPITLTYT